MRPRLLDLFCGAGGAAMGYYRAGFDVVGVDIKPQPRYPFEFHQGDALAYPTDRFDAIHASPPCQAYSQGTLSQRARGDVYPDLVAPTRQTLNCSGLPWVIENVPGAPQVGRINGFDRIIRQQLGGLGGFLQALLVQRKIKPAS